MIIRNDRGLAYRMILDEHCRREVGLRNVESALFIFMLGVMMILGPASARGDEQKGPLPGPAAALPFVNTIGMRFVPISPGTFMMGSPSDEAGRADDEQLHEVRLTQGFYLGVTEVTQDQWRSIMGDNPSVFKKCGGDCPVENVSWNDCQEFIRRLNEKEKTDAYRLPTEAEWEYACRAGSSTALYSGPLAVLGANNAPALDQIAWYGGNSCVGFAEAWDCSQWPERQYACARCGPHAVGKKKQNAWGLHDMLGNVWEWCNDASLDDPDYPTGPVTDPKGASPGEYRMVRGGSWESYAGACRSAARDNDHPKEHDFSIGFRVAKKR
jgi:formylglycine-generating enzyme required for sulfatase activity